MNIIDLYKKFFSNESIRHISLNWSQTEQGLRHPKLPVGLVLRDQGQTDLYAGKSRLILGVNGECVNISTNYHNIAEKISFTSKGITNFRILGKHFVQEIYDGQKVLAIKTKKSIKGYSVIGPNTYVMVDGQIGEIINPTPLEEIFDERLIFTTEDETGIAPAPVEIFKFVDSLIKGKTK